MIQFLVKYLKLIIHVLFWFFFFILTVGFFNTWLPANGVKAPLSDIVLYTSGYIGTLAAVAYLNHFFLFPQLFLYHRYSWYASLVIASIIIGILLKVNLDVIAMPTKPQWAYTLPHYSASIMPFIFVFIVDTFSLLIEAWFGKMKNENDLKNAKLEADLKWLRSQISPHFLFNTLNNLYTLVYFKSDAAPGHILQLSDMMRYILHESNDQLVPLSKEITFMENFINLQKLKYEDPNKINFSLHNASGEILIPPLLFINFIENSFKHGNLDKQGGYVDINFNVTTDRLELKVENSFLPETRKDKIRGIGLENVKQRLELIFPDKYELSIENSDLKFKVFLKINLVAE